MTNTFICFVSRDKALAQQLIALMEANGMTAAPIKLRLGDRPVEKIKEGFSHADNGSLLLSPAFFKNPWPRSDLDELGMMAQSSSGFDLTIVWNDVDAAIIASYSPMLASVTGRLVDEFTILDRTTKGISLPSMYEQKEVMRGGGHNDNIVNRRTLHNKITEYFSNEELRIMAYDLNIEQVDFDRGRKSIVIDLIGYMERRGRLDELVQRISELRPAVIW